MIRERKREKIEIIYNNITHNLYYFFFFFHHHSIS